MAVLAQRPRCSSNLIWMRRARAAFPATRCSLKAQCLNASAAPPDPMLSLYAAVTRRTLDGKNPNGWIPEQKISLEEAIRAYTIGSADAEFQENEKGTIAPGKLGDIIILSRDIFQIDPNEI